MFLTFLVLFDHLLSHSDIRNQVRLNALSASRETSAWLKAIPIPSLGLDIPDSEFHIDLWIWLGIRLIPPSSSLICPCTQFIDQYGDHILGCSLQDKETQHTEKCNISCLKIG